MLISGNWRTARSSRAPTGRDPSLWSALWHMRFTYGTRQRFGSLGGQVFPGMDGPSY